MSRLVHPIPAGILASLVGVAIFEVSAPWGFVIARRLERGFVSPDISGESWLVGAPSLFLLELLVGWATYQYLRKTGRVVSRSALVSVVVGLILWPFFFGLIGFGRIDRDYASLGESWFIGFVVFRAPILFLLALLVGRAAYQYLHKTGRFTLGSAVGIPALIGVIVGLVLGVYFFVWTAHAQVAATVLAGMIGGGAAGATFWALVHDGRGASAA